MSIERGIKLKSRILTSSAVTGVANAGVTRVEAAAWVAWIVCVRTAKLTHLRG